MMLKIIKHGSMLNNCPTNLHSGIKGDEMFMMSDIREVQKIRPDLDDEKASEILGFLCDVYSDKPYKGENSKLFAAAADLMYPEGI